MNHTVIALFALRLLAPTALPADDFLTTELTSEEASGSLPFSLSGVEAFRGGLRLFIAAPDVTSTIHLYETGVLEAQLSRHNGDDGTASPVSLALLKAVWCSGNAPLYLGYQDPPPGCGGSTSPIRVEYLFEVPVLLGPEDDLAIGLDPDFLWIVERKN